MSQLVIQVNKMKNPRTLRKGYGLPEYLAFCNIRSAMRPVIRAEGYVVALVRPPDANATAYFRAADAVLRRGDRWKSVGLVEFDPLKPKNSMTAIDEALQETKVIILFPSLAAIPDFVRVAADLIVELQAPSLRQIKGVFRWWHRSRLSDEQAERLLALDTDLQRAVARPGRSVGRMLAHLVMRAKETAARPLPESANTEIALRLETMSGYGAARDWGVDLARDITDWKAGLIPWSDVDGGLLLSGPPGVGKTIFAEALANTCGVELVTASAARWQSRGHLGDMQRAMFRSFEDARAAAPAILFIDEIDSFTDRDREESRNASYVRQVINAFLECLDGTVDREGVVVVGACNNPAVIDGAILRPGRLDQHVRLGYPDAEARKGILRMHLRGDLADDDLSRFAEESVGMSGADIAQVVRLARRVARRHRRAIVIDDVLGSLPGRVSLSLEVRRKVAIHELGHAVIAVSTGTGKLWGVSIESRISNDVDRQILGGAVLTPDDWQARDRQSYLDNICILLGGIAAEQVLLGQHSDGASSDLDHATRLAVVIDRHLGMNGLLHSWPAGLDEQRIDEARRYDAALMVRVEKILVEQLDRARNIIQSRRWQIERLLLELVDRGSLSGAEIEETLWVEDKIPLPATPKTRRKIRNR
tara:strand:+ start:22206 stop:24152 length:1947 start_codon:yes stop_codon:yes gene_type:complete